MKCRAGLLLWCGLLPGWATAQISTDTCCRPARPRVAPAGPAGQVALAAADPLLYDPAKPVLLVFRWKSGAPIYATDEQFIFQLIALPSNKMLLERTTTSRQVAWPPGLKLPDATTGLTYSVQATRRDQAGEQCSSPITTGTLLLVTKRPAPSYK